MRRGLAERRASATVRRRGSWPAFHVTTPDAQTLFDPRRAPGFARGRPPDASCLARRGRQCARAARTGDTSPLARDDATLADAMARRAGDWSEVRPESGLARKRPS
ncbi:MAG: DUF2309 family protein [Sandaracinus sp.]|nr:DUF2309 family protein [Sandaracinus sp.]